jgi:predicted transcriptional regulator of viral defense system
MDMTSDLIARLAEASGNRWGLVTTAQAERAGISRKQMSRLASLGAVVRVAQGVYRMAPAGDPRLEGLVARWLMLAAPVEPTTATGAPSVVASGESAALLHGIGSIRSGSYEFIVPDRRRTRLPGVVLRADALTPGEVTVVDRVPVLTVERTVADLLANRTPLAVVDRLLREAVRQKKLASTDKFAQYLAPQAARPRARPRRRPWARQAPLPAGRDHHASAEEFHRESLLPGLITE